MVRATIIPLGEISLRAWGSHIPRRSPLESWDTCWAIEKPVFAQELELHTIEC
jgi:hypothetical protein